MSYTAWTTRYTRRTTELSRTQGAIAACLLDALTDAEITQAVGIPSESAVKSQILRMREKLGARNRTHLALILDRQARSEGPLCADEPESVKAQGVAA